MRNLDAPLLVCEPVLADACIVRMAETFGRHRVFTLDSDFAVYRKHGRESLELITP